MRVENGFKQPRDVVCAGLAFCRRYLVFSRLGLTLLALLANSAHSVVLATKDPIGWNNSASGYEVTYGSWSEALNMACFFESGRISASFAQSIAAPYGGQNMSIGTRRCKIDRYGTYSVETVYVNVSATPVCAENGVVFTPYGGEFYTTSKCDVPTCPASSSQCLLKSTSPISSIPGSACVESCQIVQSITGTEDRFIGGVHTWYYSITKASTGSKCSATGGAAGLVSCNATEVPPQDPCALPDSATNQACNGGGGCPAGQTVLANGACTPNDSNAPCVPPSYRNSQGACIPYSGPGTGSGTGGSGTAGSGGNSGATGGQGGSGGAGGAGSGTGGGAGGGGGSGGQGGGGGSGGGGGEGGKGGDGGATKDDVKCGTTGDLCQSKFQQYYDSFKEFFTADAGEVAEGKAEMAKSRAGGYQENPLNKGPVFDVSNLQLNTGGVSIPGGGSCPAPRQISLPSGGALIMDYAPICQFAGYIRYVLLAVAAMLSASIVTRAF